MRTGSLCDIDDKILRNGPLVSIVVPVYNTPEGPLRRCLNSLLAQDYKNIELIVVDDGSDEGCLSVLNDELSTDHRARVIVGGHEGVSRARNNGIDSSRGDWIAFADADDEVEPHFISESLEVALVEDCDLVCGGVDYLYRGDTSGGQLLSRKYFVVDEKCALTNAKMQMLGNTKYSLFPGPDYKGRGPVAKLYRRALLDKLRFDTTIPIGEDTLFNYRFIELSMRIAIVDAAWYYYYQYEGSAVHSAELRPWKRSIHGILADRKENEPLAPFISRCAFMSAQAVESLVRSDGLLAMRTKGTDILEFASSRGCYSEDCFKGYDPSLWLKLFVCLCKAGHFNLAAMYWGAKVQFKDLIMKRKLIDPSTVSVCREEDSNR